MNSAVEPSAEELGRVDLAPTPSASSDRAAPNASRSGLARGVPSSESDTGTGSLGAGREVLVRGLRGLRRLDVVGQARVEVERRAEAEREDVASTGHQQTETAAKAPGLRPMESPILAEAGASWAPPATSSTARTAPGRAPSRWPGTSVSAASRVTATAIARAGPMAWKMPSELEQQRQEGHDHRAAGGGDRLAGALQGVHDGVLGAATLAQPLAVAEQEEQDVVGRRWRPTPEAALAAGHARRRPSRCPRVVAASAISSKVRGGVATKSSAADTVAGDLAWHAVITLAPRDVRQPALYVRAAA